jgi:hypothetical protein
MTERARVASLPDGTPVGDLPLPRAVINRLRVEGVPTLGDLRAMRDHDLLRLRAFGRGSLAAVRSLVPAPAAASSEVMIAGRRFTLGAVYARQPRLYGHRRRRLLGHDPDSPLPGGRVEVEVVASGRLQVMAGTVWVAWAGEPVGDGPGDSGR